MIELYNIIKSDIVIYQDQYIQLSSCHKIIINNKIDMHNIALRVTCGTENVHCNSKKKYLYNYRLNNKLLYDNGKKVHQIQVQS